ncbi:MULTISPECIES: TIGR03571 family LLM class oxidoreductase [unclassified Rhizobium]|uniref:TIGR03571 family LLM class oxidoreductase n=1 Tax=unclassified Rhizobium TaxID=2613769 RepID=UPI001ADC8931|nr:MULTISPECIES: TIGR03571 family LLM class oxidoreductase [unclassified Rhizobium]MBO9123775.1 TIGR03571 family LLM class oxidoreductase [Rhizobium sp. 16-488-2b]MBO9174307.1 TIGR03571 family LLM class oxidoreductase [Rhizobium sp. 16-488-2a]
MPDQPNGYSSIFQQDRISIGLVLPARETNSPDIDFQQQLEAARLADSLGFAAVWVRDVPLNGPWYPENFGHPDPFVMLGAIAAATSRISIGTAATVLTLRHPLHVAKAAISLDHLSGGRFVLGLGSGDRREEFVAFGKDSEDRRDLFRDNWQVLSSAIERPLQIQTDSISGHPGFEMRPPPFSDIPMIAIGSAGQSLNWIARNASGWATYHRPPEVQRDRHALWRQAVSNSADGAFRSFSVAIRIELTEKPFMPAEPIDLGYRVGSRQLPEVIEALRANGVHHLMLNLLPNGDDPSSQLEALAHDVLPSFA